MAIPVLGTLLRAAGQILGVSSISDVVDAISNNKLTPEQRVELERLEREHEQAILAARAEELKTVVSESIAMIQSPYKFVAFARPAMLYAATASTCFLVVTIALSIFNGKTVDSAAIGLVGAVLTPLWGATGWYIHSRTKEKMNGNGNGD